MQSSSNKTVSSEDGSKYLSLGHIPFWPVNPMATSIKNIYPNKFHNSLPNLPLLLLPYALVWRYVYLHACTVHHHSFPAGASMYKHTHTESLYGFSAAGSWNVPIMLLSFLHLSNLCMNDLCINNQAVVIVEEKPARCIFLRHLQHESHITSPLLMPKTSQGTQVLT